MGLDKYSDADEENRHTCGNKSRYKQFDRNEFEECLEKASVEFEEVDYDWTKELVYEAYSENKTFTIRVYSSLDKRSGKARDKGSDAIRLVLVHTETGRPLAKQKRTNRIQTYCKNLLKKIENVVGDKQHITLCGECSSPMVIRENSDSGDKFYGCTSYPDCRNTKPLD